MAQVEITTTGNKNKLQHSLFIHQKGQTDYLIFCRQAAEAGVEKWTVDIKSVTCTYYDKCSNATLIEAIPEPSSNYC